MKYGRIIICLALTAVLGIGAIGCQKRAEFATDESAVYLTHTIKFPGETLFSIAAWYTGSGQNWSAVARSNPGLNPARMKIGDTIKIPRRLVTRTEPYPRSQNDVVPAKRSGPAAEKSAEKEKSEKEKATNSAVVPALPTIVASSSSSSSAVSSSSMSNSSSSSESEIEAFEDEVVPAPPASSAATSSVSSAASSAASSVAAQVAPVITAPALPVEKHAKSRDELLQELLKDY